MASVQKKPARGGQSPQRQSNAAQVSARSSKHQSIDASKDKNPFAGLPTKNISYSNGATYDGQVNPMNQRHGKGTLNFPNKEAVYEGFFEGGAMTKGKISYLQTGSDCWFEGTFVNGAWSKGSYKKGTAVYEGTFESQTMNGKYKVTWTSGITYNGQIENNKLHGEGVMNFTQGNIKSIKGVWNQDTLETCSLLTMKDESTATNYVPSSGKLVGPGTVKVGHSTYTGTWDENGRLNGNGSIANDNDQGSFEGLFKDNVREGQGTYTWSQGQGEYIGLFKSGMRHTEIDGPDGVMTWRQGEAEHTYVGKWDRGQCTVGRLDGNPVDQQPQ